MSANNKNMKNKKLMMALADIVGTMIGVAIVAAVGGSLLSLSVEGVSFFQGMGIVSAIGCAVRMGNYIGED